MRITRDQAHELRELTEDVVEHYCDQETISGETAWTVVGCIAEAKIAQLQRICK